jgi:stage V sporulation protein G
MLAVHDIKIVQGDERIFVAMPSRKDENGVFRDIVHPISPSSRQLLEETILEAYSRQLAMSEAEENGE